MYQIDSPSHLAWLRPSASTLRCIAPRYGVHQRPQMDDIEPRFHDRNEPIDWRQRQSGRRSRTCLSPPHLNPANGSTEEWLQAIRDRRREIGGRVVSGECQNQCMSLMRLDKMCDDAERQHFGLDKGITKPGWKGQLLITVPEPRYSPC